MFLIARQGFIIDAVPPAYRARALSTLGGSHRVGLFFGPLLGAGIIHVAGLAWVFVMAAAFSLAAALLALPDARPQRRGPGRAAGATGTRRSAACCSRTATRCSPWAWP